AAVRALRAQRVGRVEREARPGRVGERYVLALGATVGILDGDGVGAGGEPGEAARRLERAADREAERTAAAAAAGGDAAAGRAVARRLGLVEHEGECGGRLQRDVPVGGAGVGM